MIQELYIKNLAVIEEISIQFQSGMTVITGETGAGKSIFIDALGLILGQRADSQLVRTHQSQAEICARFNTHGLRSVQDWLTENNLTENQECIVRRVLSADGGSRSSINGSPVTLSQLKELGEQLIHLHAQHQHQTLLKTEWQRDLLDQFAKNDDLKAKTRQAYQQWYQLCQKQKELTQQQNQIEKLSFLQYQIQELKLLHLKENEVEELEETHKMLSSANEWLAQLDQSLNTLSNEEGGTLSQLYRLEKSLNTLKSKTYGVDSTHELIQQAIILLEEASDNLQQIQEKIAHDPERLADIERRLTVVHDLARKHRIPAKELYTLQAQLEQEISELETLESTLQSLERDLDKAESNYQHNSQKLTQNRTQFAKILAEQIQHTLHELDLPKAQLVFDIQPGNPSVLGSDTLEILISLNPGQSLQPLRKIASGGELSRISLAIQVITAEKNVTPTLIFDEADTGISGKTAQTVGRLMRNLGTNAQVLCVTHLPQIAAQGKYHYFITKNQENDKTKTRIDILSQNQRIEAIAKLLSGDKITPQALQQAEELLKC